MPDRDHSWQPETRESLIQRLAASEAGSQWQHDADAFQRTYLPMIDRLMLQTLRSRFDAETEAGSFLGHVFERTVRLARWDPKRGRFRDYLAGWLRNYQRSERRRDTSHERRRRFGGDAHELDLADENDFLATMAAAHEQAWAESVTTAVLERMHETAPETAFVLARHYGLRLPGDDDGTPPQRTFAEIGRELGISAEAARRRKDRAARRLLGFYLEALREGPRDLDVGKAFERLFGSLQQAHPELMRDLEAGR